MKEKYCFDEFKRYSYRDWLDKVITDIGKEKSNKLLTWQPERALEINTYYDATNQTSAHIPLKSNTSAKWQYIEWVEVAGNVTIANHTILDALMNGAGGINLIGRFDNSFDTLLKGVHPDHCTIVLSESTHEVVRDFIKWHNTSATKQHANGIFLSHNHDDIKNGIDTTYAESILLQIRQSQWCHAFNYLHLDGHRVIDKGGSVQTEIAYLLSKCVFIINRELKRGLSITAIAEALYVSTAIASSYFLELTKINVIKQLIAQIFQQFGVADVTVYVHAKTSSISKSAIDKSTNFLRCTTEAMSAVIGGVDSLSIVAHHDLSIANRIARNISNLLSEESHLSQVKEVADGAYYMEELSNKLARQSWKKFQQMESKGGYEYAIRTEIFKDEIKKDLTYKLDQIASGKKQLVGINDFGNQDESVKAQDLLTTEASWAMEFEQVRQAVELHVLQNGEVNRPTVYLATIGDNHQMINARRNFISNFFSWAGIKLIGLTPSVELNQNSIIAWCGGGEYYHQIPSVLASMQIAKPVYQVIAGSPAVLKHTGVTMCIHIKSNRLQTVIKILSNIGINIIHHE